MEMKNVCFNASALARCEFIEIEFIGYTVSAAESVDVGDDLVTTCNMTISFLTRAAVVQDPTTLSNAGATSRGA